MLAVIIALLEIMDFKGKDAKLRYGIYGKECKYKNTGKLNLSCLCAVFQVNMQCVPVLVTSKYI